MDIPNLDNIFNEYGKLWCNENGGKCEKVTLMQPGFEDYKLKLTNMEVEYYGEAESTLLSEIGSEQILKNSTSLTQSQTITLSKQTTNTFSWNVTKGFKLSLNLGFSLPLPEILAISSSFNGEVNFSKNNSKVWAESKTWNVSQPVLVPSQKEVKASLLIDVNKYYQKFHYKCVLSGYICTNSLKKIDGHRVWFHKISNVFKKIPQEGFTIVGDNVHFQGEGEFKAMVGIRTRVNLNECSLDGKNVYKTYCLVEPLNGAGIVGIHDCKSEKIL